MNKKFCSIILLLFITSGLLASCGSDGKSDQTSADTSDTDTTAPEQTGPIPSYLPDVDLGGFELRFATYSNDNGKFWYSEEETGDVVNDAVYKSSNLVCDTYNAKISLIIYGAAYTNVRDFTVKSIQSGDDAFDIVNGHDCTMWSMSLDGLFTNVRSLQYQDFTQSWYPKYANDQYEINGKQYIFSSYMSYQSLSMSRTLLINKSIADKYNMEVPYDDVRNGTWTLDKMLAMCAQVYEDLNGNSQRDKEDVYGFIGFKKLYGFQAAFVNCYVKDSQGVISLDYDKERFIDTVTKMNKLFNGGEGGFLTGDEPDPKMFIDGQGLFYYSTLNTLTTDEMRASDVNYGILPIPKFDEKQESYKSAGFDCQFAIPVTVTQPDKISLLVEALGSAGYSYILDAYFETALSTKYTRDEESIEMLKIVGDTMIVDLAYMNTSSGINGLGRAFMYCFTNPNAGVASYLDSIQNTELANIEKLNKFFAD